MLAAVALAGLMEEANDGTSSGGAATDVSEVINLVAGGYTFPQIEKTAAPIRRRHVRRYVQGEPAGAHLDRAAKAGKSPRPWLRPSMPNRAMTNTPMHWRPVIRSHRAWSVRPATGSRCS
jgi:hypothetical protein